VEQVRENVHDNDRASFARIQRRRRDTLAAMAPRFNPKALTGQAFSTFYYLTGSNQELLQITAGRKRLLHP
jgi:hypothetical protein